MSYPPFKEHTTYIDKIYTRRQLCCVSSICIVQLQIRRWPGSACREEQLTEVGNPGIGRLDLIGNTEDGRDLHKRRRHHLTVEDGLAEVHSSLRPQDAARPRRLNRPATGQRPRQGRHRKSLPVTHTTQPGNTQLRVSRRFRGALEASRKAEVGVSMNYLAALGTAIPPINSRSISGIEPEKKISPTACKPSSGPSPCQWFPNSSKHLGTRHE